MSHTANSGHEIDRLARKRVGRNMGGYIHAFVFFTVNIGLAPLAAMSGRHWLAFLAFGWGLALLIHGMMVFLFMPGNGLRERMIQCERDRLTAQRDPW